MGKAEKRKFNESKNENEFDLPAKHLVKSHTSTQEKRLIVILDGAQMETVKVNLFNCFY